MEKGLFCYDSSDQFQLCTVAWDHLHSHDPVPWIILSILIQVPYSPILNLFTTTHLYLKLRKSLSS